MTHLPGDRRVRGQLFHDSRGRHAYPHPETYEPRRSMWTTWERRYAAHLDRHKELIENPEPEPGDSQVITDLFAHIRHLEKIIDKEKQLIRALRERAASHPEADEADLGALHRRIRKESGRGPDRVPQQ